MKHEAFNQLYKLEMKRIYYYLRKRGCTKEDAEDIVQETFITLYEHIETIHEDKLSSWLFRVATNRYFDLCRRKKRRTFTEFSEETLVNLLSDNATDQQLLSVEKGKFTISIISNMKILYQHLLILKYEMDYSYLEIANLIGINENTVKTYLFRARNEFKQKWEDTYERDR